MKNKIMIMAIAFMFLLAFAQNVNAEITLWKDTIVDYNKSIVRVHGYYQFMDESTDLIGRYKTIPVAIIYNWDDIPYNISQYYPQYINAQVDWCNFTVVHDSNQYSVLEGNLNSSAEAIFNDYITSASAGNSEQVFYLKHRDSLVIDFDCHYTNQDTLFIDSFTFGDFQTYFPAFTCKGCEETKLEELAKQIDYEEQNAYREISMYQKFQTVVKLNYNLWVFASWIIKIGLIFISLTLIFLVAYMFYGLLNSMARGK